MMSQSKENSTGFTLVELIVVLAIMSLTLSLTGGLILESINKQQRLVEIEKVKKILKSVSYESILNGRTSFITLQNNKLKISGINNREVEFKELRFLPLEFSYNVYGVSTTRKLDVYINGNIKEVEIDGLYRFSGQ
ncbi:pilus assembly FimT family protein [Pseudoalteromonas xiamenensis]